MALGHPKGLFPLFFTEMWERLAFYTLVGILLLYATDFERGGLGLPQAQGNEIYGLYLAFVYFTPFLGGMIADRFIGYRRAVAIGGLIMSAGLFLMGIPGFTFFILGLTGVVIGNGMFKPNISVMVGNLYQPGDAKRDSGFNIFYMGINIGALAATLIVAPMVRNVWGWLWAFRAAGAGVLLAVVILVTQWKVLERADRQPQRDPEDMGFGEILAKVILPAAVVGILGYAAASAANFTLVRPAVCGFLAGMLPVIFFFVRMGLKAREDERPGLLALLPIYVAGAAFFMILHLNGSAMTQWARDFTDRSATGAGKVLTSVLSEVQQEALPNYYINAGEDVPRPDPRSLLVVDGYLTPAEAGPGVLESPAEVVGEAGEEPVEVPAEPVAPILPSFDAATVARMYGQQRMDEAVVEALAGRLGDGLSVELFAPGEVPADWADRAVDVYPAGVVGVVSSIGAHGERLVTVELPDRAQEIAQAVFVRRLDDGRRIATFLVDRETYEAVYQGYRERFGREPELLPPGRFIPVINPEVYQSWNPLFVILLTPVVVWFLAWRVRMGKPIPTAHKLLYGMILTTAAVLLMALAGLMSDGGATKVSGLWLASFYLVVTLGELFLSPMGLSLVTKLSPKRLVGLTMGGWFLATSFGNNLSGFFGGIQGRMEPMPFFLLLAGLSGLVALFILAVLPRLDRAINKYGA